MSTIPIERGKRAARPKDDRLPPHDLKAERGLIGSVLLRNELLGLVAAVEPDEFYRDSHQVLWRGIIDLHRTGMPVDPITLHNWLELRGLTKRASFDELDEILSSVPHAANGAEYASIVAEKARLRGVIEAMQRMVDDCYGGVLTVDQVLARAEASLRTIGDALPLRGEHDLVIGADEVEEKEPVYIWKDRLPIGFITMFAGRSGEGKSFVACDLAARLSRGDDMPDHPGNGEIRGTLFISEDPIEYMLRPRLRKLGADLSRVKFMTLQAMSIWTLSDIPMLTRAWEAAGRPGLLIIDPPTNFLNARDENSNSEVRQILKRLVTWLQERECAAILITHLNKGGKGVDAMSRMIGSIAWATSCRVQLSFYPHPEQEGLQLVTSPKNNIGRKAQSLAYRIVDDGPGTVSVRWEGEVDITADEANAGELSPRGQNARAFLVEAFTEKRTWLSDDLFAAAAAKSISRKAIFEAKKAGLPIDCRKGTAEESGQWLWVAQPGWPPRAQQAAELPDTF